MKTNRKHYRHKKKAHHKKFGRTLKDVLATLANIATIINFIIPILHQFIYYF